MQRARELTGAIEATIAGGRHPTPHLQACIDRSVEAWYPEKLAWKDIEKTVQVVARVNEQLRLSPPDSESALLVIAQVVRRRLPSSVRRNAGLSTVVSVIQDMHRETIESIAQRQALVRLLGWQDMVEGWAQRVMQLSTGDQNRG